MGSVFIWWLAVWVVGLAAFPVAFVALKHFPDKGYVFSKVLGLLLMGYIYWVLGYAACNSATLFAAFLILAGISAALCATWIGRPFLEFAKKNLGFFLVMECLFLMAFIVAGAYKMRTFEIVGTEKPMDFAMINGILASPSMPPQDPWLSGGSISYYYFGYFIVAMLCRMTSAFGVTSGEAYNLAVALTWALAAVCAFSLVYSLTRRYRYSAFSAFCLVLFGNLDYWHRAVQSFTIGSLRAPYYNQPVDPGAATGFAGFFGFLVSPLQHGWDYFQASRIVPVPPTDKLINEFPAFSFFLSDLHPHVMAIPFVLLAIAMAYNLLKSPLPSLGVFGGQKVWQFGQWALIALVFGSMSFFNSWDFPTFMLLLGSCLFLQQWWSGPKEWWSWCKAVVLLGVPIVIGTFAFYLPFFLKFQSQARGLGLVKDRTDLYYLFVIFGLFFSILIPAILEKLSGKMEKVTKAKPKKTEELECVVCGREGSGKKFCGYCGGELVAAEASEAPVLTWKATDRSFLEVGTALYTAPITFIFWQWAVDQLNPWLPALGSFLLEHPRITLFLEFLLTAVALWLLVPLVLSLGARVRAYLTLIVPVLLLALNFLDLGTYFLALAALIAIWKVFYSRSHSRETVFTLMLVFVAFLLIGGCEMLFIKDHFSDGALYRMNSVFKFHYQVWILFSLASGPLLNWLLESQWPQWSTAKRASWLSVFLFALLAAFLYPVLTFTARMAGTSAELATMDGEVYYERAFQADHAVAQWIKKNVKPHGNKMPVILEAWGGSYQQQYARLATVTGYPTVLGWDFHEAQWRGSWDKPVVRGQDPEDNLFRRRNDIDAIYTSGDLNLTRELMRRYGVDYVYIGDVEREKYKDHLENLSKFNQLGMVVQQQGNAVLYQINP